jgi:hypothetical protein
MQQQPLPLLCEDTSPTCSTESILASTASSYPTALVNMASSYQPSRLVTTNTYKYGRLSDRQISGTVPVLSSWGVKYRPQVRLTHPLCN